jgi:hypothetical protein
LTHTTGPATLLPPRWDSRAVRPRHILPYGQHSQLEQEVLDRTHSGDYFQWLEHVRPAAGCSHPIQLHGHLDKVREQTGEILATTRTADMPDGTIYKACGNRRHQACPGCAWTYQGDAYQLIKTGLVGGKGVPASVAAHPAAFVTFTAPSFGPVHHRTVKQCVCRNKRHCTCIAKPCHARRSGTAETCPHGVTLACWKRHGREDTELGTPLCPDCYDHDHQAVWNLASGELWRRTKQAMERHLRQLARRRRLPAVRLSHGKAAEYQARGAVHFHALLRLDGIAPTDPAAIIPPPTGFTVADLEDAFYAAVDHIGLTTGPHPARPQGWPIRWGERRQQDFKALSLTGTDTVTDAMVASYLAKYATKSTEATGHTSKRLNTETVQLHANPDGNHPERLIAACWRLGEAEGWEGLRRWAHMLGFGGHFLTKARRYSITFSLLRTARISYRRRESPGPDAAEIQRQDHLDTETTLIIGTLTYAGSGWRTTADALLANTAADQARSRQQMAREELAHEIGSQLGDHQCAA